MGGETLLGDTIFNSMGQLKTPCHFSLGLLTATRNRANLERAQVGAERLH
jgi:hypothetical protein